MYLCLLCLDIYNKISYGFVNSHFSGLMIYILMYKISYIVFQLNSSYGPSGRFPTFIVVVMDSATSRITYTSVLLMLERPFNGCHASTVSWVYSPRRIHLIHCSGSVGIKLINLLKTMCLMNGICSPS